MRRYIYTSNVIGEINTVGYFRCMREVEVEIYITVNRIEKRRWRKSISLIDLRIKTDG
ncbi:MAG: hypothetical protein N2746_06615 [Deltaproteobacteria bacterium]|nr:hypothetical protein [Deltaproteobacteria bacterium]